MIRRPYPSTGLEFHDVTEGHELWGSAVEVLGELRPALSGERLAELVRTADGERLTFTACVRDGGVIGVAGWRVMTTTYAGRKLHVDDLVVSGACRSGGVGAALLEHLCDRGEQLSCSLIDLDSKVHRFEAHRFYLREQFHISAHHFVRALGRQGEQ